MCYTHISISCSSGPIKVSIYPTLPRTRLHFRLSSVQLLAGGYGVLQGASSGAFAGKEKGPATNPAPDWRCLMGNRRTMMVLDQAATSIYSWSSR